MVRLIKQFGPTVAKSAAFEKFVWLLEQSSGEPENVLRVLTYHRVDESQNHPWLDPGLISASPQAFEAQMKYLATNYEVVSAPDVIKAFESRGQTALPPRAVMITFDDAYSDFENQAWPILKQYRLPVTLFVPTAFPDHPERLFWWDRLFHAIDTTEKGELNTPVGQLDLTTGSQRKQAYKRLKNHIKLQSNDVAMKEVEQICTELGILPQANCVLGWEVLRKLAKEGVTLGAHTRTHPIMNSISLAEMHAELTGSIHDLQQQAGLTPQTFAYPSGMYNDDAVNTVQNVGFALAFTTERGINRVGHSDRLRLRRINIGARTTMPLLRAQLLSWTANFYSLGERLLLNQ